MPSKKKKYNARFPPARIKKIMQTDEDVGKVAAAVPVIISRALELFIDSLIEKTASVTRAKNAKTLSASHVKQAIHSEKTFDFLRHLVKNVPDHQTEEEADSAAPSGSGIMEKKPKIPRPRKPREEGSRGPGRPREEGARGPGRPREGGTRGPGRPKKVKLEEKKESFSEDSDEETETDEEQTADEDSQSSQQCLSPPYPQGSQYSQGDSGMSQGYTAHGQSSMEATRGAQGFGFQQQQQRIPSASSQSALSMNPVIQIPPQSETSSRVSQADPNQQGHSPQNPALVQGQRTISPVNQGHGNMMAQFQQFPAVPQGFPMPNMMFPQYPFMPGQQYPYMHQQHGMRPGYPTQGMGNIPSQFMPGGHPAYMMPPMGPNSPMLPMGPGMSGLPMRSPPPLVPITSTQNNSGGETSMPLDMSVAATTRCQNVRAPSLSQIPTPRGMVPVCDTNNAVPPLSGKDTSEIPHPATQQLRMNNQNIQEPVSRSQHLGPPPLVSSAESQSSVSLTENGKHKQNDDSAILVSKKPKQRHCSENSSAKTVSFPGLANLMNIQPVKSKQSEDDDYDT